MKKLLHSALFIVAMGGIAQAQTQLKDITLEDIWSKNTFGAKSINAIESMANGKNYTTVDYASSAVSVLRYDYQSGKLIDTVFSSTWMPDNKAFGGLASYSFSADERKLLLTTQVEPIYRRSAKANYYIFDRASKTAQLLSDKGKQQNAIFSPDGSKVAFMRDNNLFIVDVASMNEKQITFDGKFNEIINGHADWVYEEEFEIEQAFQWSPDNKKLAFMWFDESKVREFDMTMFGDLYPTNYKYKYPKAGEDNAVVGVKIYDLTSGKTTTVDVGNDKTQYIPRIQWTQDANVLSIQRMNRLQNKWELLFADQEGHVRTILKEESKTYIDVNNDLTFLDNGKEFVYASSKAGYNHLYMVSMDGKTERAITSGNWDVVSLIGVDQKNNKLYYESAENGPTERYVYTISLDGKTKQNITLAKGTNSVSFSKGFQYYIATHTDANTPAEYTLHITNGKLIRTLEDNAALKAKLLSYKMSKKEFFSFKTEEGVTLNGWMIKPYDFDANKKYPVLMYVYGGPGNNTVNNAWNGRDYFWHQMLAEKGYVVVSVDNRGTGYRGDEFKKSTYQQLGKLETEDQIATAKYLGTLSFVDSKRIGIQGWSFGGYMTSLCMTKGANYFKTGIAVAPVTNWKYYDSIYTERFLRTPQENKAGYEENSPINFADKLKGNFLLIHGTADDNVHFQNSVDFVTALVKANKPFQSFYYPNKNHGIYGGNTRLHLYNMMTDFILKNL